MKKYNYLASVKRNIEKKFPCQESAIILRCEDDDFICEVEEATAHMHEDENTIRRGIATNLALVYDAYHGYDSSFLKDDLRADDIEQIDYQIRSYLVGAALRDLAETYKKRCR